MNIKDIKEYLNNNGDNEEVVNLLDSISDKRVNQALTKLQNKIPTMVEEETLKRLDLEQQRQQEIQRESDFTKGLEDRLKDLNIPLTLGQSLTTGLSLASESDEIEQRFKDIESIKKGVAEEFMSKLGGKRIPAGGAPLPFQSTEQQVLKNIL